MAQALKHIMETVEKQFTRVSVAKVATAFRPLEIIF